MPSAGERRLFVGTALGGLVLDAVTKLVAEAYLLRTTGVSVAGVMSSWVSVDFGSL